MGNVLNLTMGYIHIIEIDNPDTSDTLYKQTEVITL